MDTASLFSWTETTARILAAALAGTLIGLNRDLHGKPIGVRTLGIVAVACCALTLASAQFGEHSGNHSAETMGRATQGLMAGIGFLGGGVILRRASNRVEGLTTAALVWLTAALGVACGVGAWIAVSVATIAAFALLTFGGIIEHASHALIDRARRAAGLPPIPSGRASGESDSR